jgi:hypothetical protein
MAENPDRPADPVDEYFERLDAAFSKLTSAAPQPAPLPVGEPLVTPGPDVVAQAFAALLALEEGEPGARAVRLAFVEPAKPAAEAPPVAEPVLTEAVVDDLVRRVVERLPPPPVIEPPAERAMGESVVDDLVRRVIERLPPPAVQPVAEPVITETIVNDLARRVVERLAPDVVRAVVVEVVSEVTERLVREEIERIRGKQHV